MSYQQYFLKIILFLSNNVLGTYSNKNKHNTMVLRTPARIIIATLKNLKLSIFFL